jgi:hypothetical protein
MHRAAAANRSSRWSVRPVAAQIAYASCRGAASESTSYLRSHTQGPGSGRSPGSGWLQTPNWNYYMATNVLHMLPPLLVFFLAQRYFVQGLSALGGVSQR